MNVSALFVYTSWYANATWLEVISNMFTVSVMIAILHFCWRITTLQPEPIEAPEEEPDVYIDIEAQPSSEDAIFGEYVAQVASYQDGGRIQGNAQREGPNGLLTVPK